VSDDQCIFDNGRTQDGLLSDQAKGIEGIDKRFHRLHVLVELAAGHGVDGGRDVMGGKVGLDRVGVELLEGSGVA
jgi:hypothetical protein